MPQVSHIGAVPRSPTVSDGVGQPVFATYEDAVRSAAEQAGGLKSVACRLRPAMAPEDAARWLAACLDAGKREKLGLGELGLLRRICRDAGVHTLAEYEAREAGYKRPVPAAREEEIRAVADQIEALGQQFAAGLARLEALKAGGWP